jgi:hypothetical protein
MASLQLLLLVVALFCYTCKCQRRNQDCTIWEAKKFRDCTCGFKYRDYEEHCEDDLTYYETTLSQESLECDFECKRGGIKHLIDPIDETYQCNCVGGGYGECCERGKP